MFPFNWLKAPMISSKPLPRFKVINAYYVNLIIDGNGYDTIIKKNNQHQDYIGYGGSKSRVGDGGLDNKRS